MKKMVFSAMALVVFTATSMAAEEKKEEKKIEAKNEKTTVKVEAIKGLPCYDAYVADLEFFGSYTSCEEAAYLADKFWKHCMRETYGV